MPCLEKLAPWATWSLLQYCVNERINYLAQVTGFPLVQDSLALMDEIIDNAILRASGLPIASPDSLTHLTTFTLRPLPCDLGGLGSWGRTVLYELAEKYTPQLLEGAILDFWWPPIVLGAAENRVWTAVAGLFRPESDFDDGTTEEPTPSDPNIFGLSTSPVGSLRPSATLSIWTTLLLVARHGARESEGQKLTSSPRGARSSASASTHFWFNSSIREDPSQKPPGCGATASNDQAVGLSDRAVS